MSAIEVVSDFENIQFFQKNPGIYFKDILGVGLESYQARALSIVAQNQRTAISACHDVGKSFLMARVALWFAACFPHSKVITTAPTFNQVKNILWSEIRSAHSRSKVPLGGTMLQTEWQISPDWFALGFTSKNEITGGDGQGTSSSFQGFHAPGGLLVIFDEATGIVPNIWNMAEGLLTQAHVKFVVIGNPTSKSSEFFKCFKDPSWSKVYLSCFDSPNLIANGLTNMETLERELEHLKTLNDRDAQARMQSYLAPVPYLLSATWVMGRALTWGLTHPLFVSKVLGKFPEEGDNVLMPLGMVEEAQRRVVFPESHERKVIGVDVARKGPDATVATYLHGMKFIKKSAFYKRDNMEVAGEVIALAKAYGKPDVICIDETGTGSGVLDGLRQYARPRDSFLHGTEIRGVQFGATPICRREGCSHRNDCEKAKYFNVKARMFDLLGQALKRGLQLPDEDVYLDELPTILYDYNSKGQMIIESKDEYKKRTGRGSPDHADSLALANYGHVDEIRVGRFRDTDDTPSTMANELSGDSW